MWRPVGCNFRIVHEESIHFEFYQSTVINFHGFMRHRTGNYALIDQLSGKFIATFYATNADENQVSCLEVHTNLSFASRVINYEALNFQKFLTCPLVIRCLYCWAPCGNHRNWQHNLLEFNEPARKRHHMHDFSLQCNFARQSESRVNYLVCDNSARSMAISARKTRRSCTRQKKLFSCNDSHSVSRFVADKDINWNLKRLW